MTRTGTPTTESGLLHLVFRWGVVAKGVYGIGEVLAGILLTLVSPQALQGWATFLTQQRLSQDPDDALSLWLVDFVGGLTASAVTFAAVYLIVHGVVKIGLLLAVATHRYRIYPWAIGVLIAFIAYQSYELVVNFGWGLLALTIFDAIIVLLTWREYRNRPTLGGEASDEEGDLARRRELEDATR
ncbi:DUF2127 domain-containing protein [Frondihabitans australicus]|uniref:Putative membrane protein n=1 Tax=Frondihabitans australicus TaxID=386892 RepID=A0A495IBG8_9MICO|nr:DUF2127 domain-containing protein [Frondihabitans australicus]RKR73347.1 putative membrane protein [Frondihabitans australicus]